MIFLNDVFFCAHDVVRLLQHKADIVCGMDFDRPKLDEAPMQARRFAVQVIPLLCMACDQNTVRSAQVQRGLLRAHLRRKYGLPDLLGALLSCVSPLLRYWRSQANMQDAFRVRPHALAHGPQTLQHMPASLHADNGGIKECGVQAG